MCTILKGLFAGNVESKGRWQPPGPISCKDCATFFMFLFVFRPLRGSSRSTKVRAQRARPGGGERGGARGGGTREWARMDEWALRANGPRWRAASARHRPVWRGYYVCAPPPPKLAAGLLQHCARKGFAGRRRRGRRDGQS